MKNSRSTSFMKIYYSLHAPKNGKYNEQSYILKKKTQKQSELYNNSEKLVLGNKVYHILWPILPFFLNGKYYVIF